MTQIPQPNTIQKEKDAEISDVKNKLPVPTLHTPENFENRIQTNRRPRLFFFFFAEQEFYKGCFH